MMIQHTVGEHRDRQKQAMETQKRKREVYEKQKQDKKQKQKIEKQEEDKTKLLTKHLTRIKSHINKCNCIVGDCRNVTVARAPKYCSCLVKDHEALIMKHHPEALHYIGCDGPF